MSLDKFQKFIFDRLDIERQKKEPVLKIDYLQEISGKIFVISSGQWFVISLDNIDITKIETL